MSSGAGALWLMGEEERGFEEDTTRLRQHEEEDECHFADDGRPCCPGLQKWLGCGVALGWKL